MPPDAAAAGTDAPWILGFDTSAARCAAALLCGDRIVAAREEAMATGQAERLIPLCAELLAGAGIGWRDLAALGVGIGPGNFTGIRIAVSAARGLALALGIPAVGVSGFEALALGQPEGTLTSLDARRGEVWLAGAGIVPVLTTPDAVPDALIAGGRDVTGTEAAAIAARTGGSVRPAAPLAPAIARIAAARRNEALPRPAPLYLRPADAAPPAAPPPRILA